MRVDEEIDDRITVSEEGYKRILNAAVESADRRSRSGSIQNECIGDNLQLLATEPPRETRVVNRSEPEQAPIQSLWFFQIRYCKVRDRMPNDLESRN